MRFALLAAFVLMGHSALAQTSSVTASTASKPAGADSKSHPASMAEMQATIDKLTQSNHEMLDLLKQQQQVLEDIQFDRRQQSHRIESLEERLEQTLVLNTQLQNKVTNLESELAVRPAASVAGGAPAANAPTASTNAIATTAPLATSVAAPTLPAKPASYLPPENTVGANGQTWHRVLTLKGTDSQQTDIFQIRGHTWRVVWHNQDPPDKKLKNTSGLFIDAFPKDDTIPQHVCQKVGSGGDTADLTGPGNYYLKITASGGSWELAVEDLQ